MSPMRLTTHAVLVLMTAAATLSSAAPAVRGPLERRPEGMPSGNRGQSSTMIFNGPAVAGAMADIPEWTRPEYARNDRNLGYRPPTALTAINEWPQPQPPSIDDARSFTLGRSPHAVIYFGSGRQSTVLYGRGGRGGYSNHYGHNRGHQQRGRGRTQGGYHRHTPLPR